MTKLTLRTIKTNAKKYIVLGKSLKNDKRVPRISKILLGLAVAYFFMPFDLIPDFIPVLGHVDDAIIIPTLIILAIKCIPKGVFAEHYTRIFKKK